MAAFVKFESFSERQAKGEFNFDAAGDTLKVFLTNEAPVVATDDVKADLVEITAENGYTAGGDDAQNSISRSGGVSSIVGVDIVWTSSGGTFGPFRYAVLYDDTHASDAMIGYWDYGSAITPAAPETFTTDFGASMFTIT